MSTKTTSSADTRTVEELRQAALDGEDVTPAQLAEAQAAEEIADLRSRGAQQRAEEQAERDRQAALGLLASEIGAHDAGTERDVARMENAISQLAELVAALKERHRQVRDLVRRARELGAPACEFPEQIRRLEDGEVGYFSPGPGSGVMGEQGVYVGDGAGGYLDVHAHEVEPMVLDLLGEVVERLDLPLRQQGSRIELRRGVSLRGAVADQLRSQVRIVRPRDEVELIRSSDLGDRRAKRVKVSRSSATSMVKYGSWSYADQPDDDGPEAA